MSDFSFSATAECDLCGKYLSSSDEECDHNGWAVQRHVFRRMREGRESIVGVKCTSTQKWYKLEEKIGDDWISYQYIGTKGSVERVLTRGTWDSIEDIPKISMSTDAPKDLS